MGKSAGSARRPANIIMRPEIARDGPVGAGQGPLRRKPSVLNFVCYLFLTVQSLSHGMGLVLFLANRPPA